MSHFSANFSVESAHNIPHRNEMKPMVVWNCDKNTLRNLNGQQKCRRHMIHSLKGGSNALIWITPVKIKGQIHSFFL